MNDSSKRDEWDRHNRDEAKERAAQQEIAGPTHKPVPTEPYANMGGAPAAHNASLDVAALIDEYERAAVEERRAWLAVRDLIKDESAMAAWNSWRDSVERTQRAARSLVECEAGRFARD